MVGIPAAKERMKDYPHQLSGGKRQRVMIAMSVSSGPQLFLNPLHPYTVGLLKSIPGRDRAVQNPGTTRLADRFL
ncbi:MAG: ATP-binding cassette domain-containing protein [Lacrimispora celerecrescens]|nr:ATP-binding cassette domain-containing protein [Lacrimispora celerecrescens]